MSLIMWIAVVFLLTRNGIRLIAHFFDTLFEMIGQRDHIF